MLCSTHLVCSAYEVEVVLVQELGRHFGAEGERHAAIVLTPTHRVLKGEKNNNTFEMVRNGPV